MINVVPDENGNVVFEQYLWDDQGDELSILDVWISHAGGNSLPSIYGRPPWLVENYTTTSTIEAGKRKVTLTFSLPYAVLGQTTYTIRVAFTDHKIDPGTGEMRRVECSFNLEVA